MRRLALSSWICRVVSREMGIDCLSLSNSARPSFISCSVLIRRNYLRPVLGSPRCTPPRNHRPDVSTARGTVPCVSPADNSILPTSLPSFLSTLIEYVVGSIDSTWSTSTLSVSLGKTWRSSRPAISSVNLSTAPGIACIRGCSLTLFVHSHPSRVLPVPLGDFQRPLQAALMLCNSLGQPRSASTDYRVETSFAACSSGNSRSSSRSRTVSPLSERALACSSAARIPARR